jgi:hypothetical protein
MINCKANLITEVAVVLVFFLKLGKEGVGSGITKLSLTTLLRDI